MSFIGSEMFKAALITFSPVQTCCEVLSSHQFGGASQRAGQLERGGIPGVSR